MSLIVLAWKNIIQNPLTLLLNLILLTLGIGLINFILLMNNQLKDKFEKNLAGVDLVVGAKGSPLQMILSSMYHIDAPTGNITIKEAKPFIREGHPLIETSVPLSLGDSYKGYRIVGTDYSILQLYNAEIAQGKLWHNLYEVTIGHEVATKQGLRLGSTFKSSHGFNDDDDMERDHGTLKVVGILKPTGSVIDLLILVNTESVWAVHDHDHAHEEEEEEEEEDTAADSKTHDHGHTDHDHDHNHDAHNHEGHNHEGHDHEGHNHEGHDHTHDHSAEDHRNDMSRAHLLTHEEEEITSILVKFKNKKNFMALSMPRNINENTDLQAASPAYEINRLYDMMGTGTKALQLIAILIAIVSGISIFVSLLNSLKARKYELSLMRVMGGRPLSLLLLILFEGLILALIGFVLGMLVSHIGMMLLGQSLQDKYNYQFVPWTTHGQEVFLFLTTCALGLAAAFIPAFMAYKTDIHKNLSEG